MSVKTAIEVATVIFQEAGKDRRTEMLKEERLNNGFRSYSNRERPTVNR